MPLGHIGIKSVLSAKFLPFGHDQGVKAEKCWTQETSFRKWIGYLIAGYKKMMTVHIIEVYATPEISEMADNQVEIKPNCDALLVEFKSLQLGARWWGYLHTSACSIQCLVKRLYMEISGCMQVLQLSLDHR